MTNKLSIIMNEMYLLSDKDFKDLGALYNTEMKARRVRKAGMVKAKLMVGKTVSWTGRKGGFQSGTVVKINRTRAQVDTSTGIWNVPLSMLSVTTYSE